MITDKQLARGITFKSIRGGANLCITRNIYWKFLGQIIFEFRFFSRPDQNEFQKIPRKKILKKSKIEKKIINIFLLTLFFNFLIIFWNVCRSEFYRNRGKTKFFVDMLCRKIYPRNLITIIRRKIKFSPILRANRSKCVWENSMENKNNNKIIMENKMAKKNLITIFF